MYQFKLSSLADEDLTRLLQWGITEFGLDAAIAFYDELIQHLYQIAENPLLYQSVDHIRSNYRRSTFKKNAVYYQIEYDIVLIQRILQYQSTDELP